MEPRGHQKPHGSVNRESSDAYFDHRPIAAYRGPAMRADGFDRMDVATSVVDDPKFRRLARRYPDRFAVAFTAYIGLMALCWREGERFTLEEGWPALLAYDVAAVEALTEVGLVDAESRIPPDPWSAWFGAASQRRALGRERQRKADQRRGRSKQADSQTGSTGQTDRQAEQAGPTSDERGSNVGQSPTPSRNGTNAIGIVPSEGPCRICGGYLTDREPCQVGPGWIEHNQHPAEWEGEGVA